MIDKSSLFLYLVLFCSYLNVCHGIDAKALDDTVLFKIMWPGKDGYDALESDAFETLLVTTANNEKYKCLMPQNLEKEKEPAETYTGPNAIELLSPLFTQASCSYRLESYWSYELCHGRYIRQYHEERDGKKHKLQEYYLGKMDKKQLADKREELEHLKEVMLRPNLPIKKIDGISLPYFQLNMSDGTLCDLNGKPRMTKVQYVCYAHGKHEVYSLKESSTCEYEAVVLSPLLCQHPDYRALETGEHPINCLPLEGTPKKPRELLSMEAESLKLRHQKGTEENMQQMYAVFSIDRDGDAQDGEARIRVELQPLLDENTPDSPATLVDPKGPQPPPSSPLTPPDSGPAKNFLSGQYCITGGSGWWRYEYCHGQSVQQFHESKEGNRDTIKLGQFDLKKHKEWLEKNPHKKPKAVPLRKQVSHFYSDGSFCEKMGRPRQVEVKLKCLEDSSPGAVALYLLEPRVCEYLLGVESPLLCDMLPLADEYGMLPAMYLESRGDKGDAEESSAPVETEDKTESFSEENKQTSADFPPAPHEDL